MNVETSQEVCLKRMIVGADPRAEKVARAEMAVFESLKGLFMPMLVFQWSPMENYTYFVIIKKGFPEELSLSLRSYPLDLD